VNNYAVINLHMQLIFLIQSAIVPEKCAMLFRNTCMPCEWQERQDEEYGVTDTDIKHTGSQLLEKNYDTNFMNVYKCMTLFCLTNRCEYVVS
jgi:hypothetical protein